MRPTFLAALLFTGCAYPTFVASKVIEITLPAAGLDTIHCTSHNGDIVLQGDPAATEVALRAELSVRGHSQGEADANLHLLSLGKDLQNGRLDVYGKYPASELRNMSPSFAFTLKVPPQVAVTLTSHNGDVESKGTRGPITLSSHNGDIVAEATTSRVKAETHNGRVQIDLANQGPLDGEITSHNGDIIATFADGIGTSLVASTHNGEITPPRLLQDATLKKRSLQCRIGDGGGNLRITTHNGDVRLR